MNLRVGHLLAIGFLVVVALFVGAAAITLRNLARLDSLEARLAALDLARHDGLLVQSAIQEQYIHQAHTLIEGSDSHLGHYGAMAASAARAIGSLEHACERVGFADSTAAIDDVVVEMDRVFMMHVVPLIGVETSDKLRYHHSRLEQLTELAAARIGELNDRIEIEADAALAEFSSLLERTRVVTLGALLLAAVLAFCVGSVLVRAIGRPVDRLHAALVHAESGRLDTRVEPEGPKELRDLADRFNAMAAALAESREQVARNARLAAMGEVAAGVAHEINNPLGVIKGYLGLLRATPMSASNASELSVIGDEVERCAEIVRGLLDLARPRRLQLAAASPSSVIEESVSRVEASLERRIEVDLGLDLPAARFDEKALRQILDNLIKNAVEAAPEGGRVRVVARADARAVSIAIDDSGPGIASEVRERLFRPFVTTKVRGTGLGLAVAESLAREMGASLDVERSELGGARFVVRLERAKEAEVNS